MQFVSIEKKKKKIVSAHQVLKDSEWHDLSEKSPEVPLASFPEAMQALSTVVCELMSLPKDQHGQLIPYKFAVSRTKEGTRSVQIWFNRLYEELGSEQKEKTPVFRIDPPSGDESGVVVLDKKHLDIVGKALHEAERYITGDRQQLTFDDLEQKNSAVSEGEAEDTDLTLEG